jgi:16S rRNA (guanine527-N7)-methyltransferase
MSGPSPELITGLASRGIELDADDNARLGRFLDLLEEANAKFNLTAIRGRAQAWERHVADSLELLPYLASAPAEGDRLRVADVGSGGGMPGLVLACVMPEAEFTLIESVGKKARFLGDAARALGLGHVSVEQRRAEDLGQDHRVTRERFDAVTSRAVARLPLLLELCLPLVRPGGVMLTIKGEQAAAEVAESARELGELRGAVVDQVRTPTGTVVVIEKTGRTPRTWPRAATQRPSRS